MIYDANVHSFVFKKRIISTLNERIQLEILSTARRRQSLTLPFLQRHRLFDQEKPDNDAVYSIAVMFNTARGILLLAIFHHLFSFPSFRPFLVHASFRWSSKIINYTVVKN